MIAALYDWLLFLHILCAIVWVGGAISLQIIAIRVNRRGPAAAYALLGDFEFVGTRIFMPTSLLLLVLGIWMVSIGPWSFHQTWILLGLAMFAYSFVSGAFFLSPQLRKTREVADEKGPDSAEVGELTRRLFIVSRIELVFLVLIVADMVLKPFL